MMTTTDGPDINAEKVFGREIVVFLAIFGLSTVLTLVVLPVIYSLFYRVRFDQGNEDA